MPLNARQQRFVEAYVQTGSATQAAKASGYSAKTAYSIGSRLLKNVEIRQAIDQAQQQAQETSGVTAAAIAKALAAIAFTATVEPVKLAHRLKALDLLTRHVALDALADRVSQIEHVMQTQLVPQRSNGYAAYPR